MKLIWAISGSFCNHAAIFRIIERMIQEGQDITVLLSQNSANMDTRFGSCSDLIRGLERITAHPVMTTLQEAETLGPHCPYDAMIIAPCTSTTAAKLAHGDFDHTCTLGAKAMLRNQRPVIIGIASNDFLGFSAAALFTLKNMKNIYLVPFYQDDPKTKPNSCISRWSLIDLTLKEAMKGKQLQPLLFVKEEDYELG